MARSPVIESPVNARVSRTLHTMAGVFAIVTIIVASLVLIGWAVDSPRLKSIFPGLVAMNPATAVAFILCGLSLVLQMSSAPNAIRLAQITGLIVALIGAWKLAALIFHFPAEVDQVVFAARLNAESIPNRMAPNTALAFALVGAALLLGKVIPRRGVPPSQVIALAVVWLAMLALVGYAYRASLLYGVGTFIPMAVHTAGLFLLLALGILFVRPAVGLMRVVCSDSPAGVLARQLLPLAGLAPVIIGWSWLAGTQRGWLPVGLELPGVILTNAVMFTALLWWELGLLRRSDAWRRAAEVELQQKHRALEETARSEREAHQALKQAQSQLVQSEKLAGLGQMVAGIAHEINNPLAFVSNNTAVVQRDLQSLFELIVLLRQFVDATEIDRAALREKIRELTEEVDLEYTLSNLPDVLTRSREGLRRIQQIVKDLRDFARLDQSDLQEADLNAGITSTINIIQGTAKKKAVKIETDLEPLPPVRCHPAKINQVIMNLLANAIDASKDGAPVRVESRAEGDRVSIAVCDSGCGIDPAIRERIFDPFFTTKPIGQGTGLGLSISYGIVKDHGGRLEVDSTPGAGSRFTVHLPTNGRHGASPPASAGRDRTA